MNTYTKKAFTLIELLIVIGIIALLAVTVLLALNPAEAQRKNRDAKRIRDAGTIEAILIQLVDSDTTVGNGTGDLAHSAGASSTGVTGVSEECDNNWMGEDLCEYVKVVPLDPQNGLTRTYQNGSASAPTTTDGEMFYRAIVSGANYEIGVRQESVDNITKITNDGGDDADWFEVYSGDSSLL